MGSLFILVCNTASVAFTLVSLVYLARVRSYSRSLQDMLALCAFDRQPVSQGDLPFTAAEEERLREIWRDERKRWEGALIEKVKRDGLAANLTGLDAE